MPDSLGKLNSPLSELSARPRDELVVNREITQDREKLKKNREQRDMVQF
jgi:hypothetical protein